MNNPLLHIDFYKADHRRQYPAGTTMVYSNLTARSSRIPGSDHTVFFGLQHLVDQYLSQDWMVGFFLRRKGVVMDEYKRMMDSALGENAFPLDHIAALHDYQKLPINILAVPEGTIVPLKVPFLTMWNSHPDFFWVTNYLETILSAMLWQPITSATTANRYRMILDKWAERTSDIPEFVDFQGHDFSFRGMGGLDAAAISGAGHLLSFKGTDTAAIKLLDEYYYAPGEFIGGSVPATEHSVMCMGTKESEIDTFRRLITELYPKGVVSIVSDTWDLWKVLTEYLPALKDQIMARDGKVVIRPDSGDPVDILCGMEYNPGYETSHGERGVIEYLWDTFGGTVNSKGYKQLDPHIGAIYGDSITTERAEAICSRLAAKGFASTNVVLGIGSYTYQYVTRDTYGMAMKATYGEVNGEPREIFKDPVTDNGTKKSARGLLMVEGDAPNLVLRDRADKKEALTESANMKLYMHDGDPGPWEQDLSNIRRRLKTQRELLRSAQ